MKKKAKKTKLPQPQAKVKIIDHRFDSGVSYCKLAATKDELPGFAEAAD